MSDVVEDLKAAREIVANGWCSRGPEDASGNLCAVMALNSVVLNGWHEYDVTHPRWVRRDAAYDELKKHLPAGFTEVARYNDAESTSHGDIMNLFDKALADLGGL